MNYVVINSDEYLAHHGVLGMKWGVWNSETRARYTNEGKMRTDLKSDSMVTRRVKNDWNNLSETDFQAKYANTKKNYKKRVDKYGDPYMNAPLAKFSKKRLAKEYKKRGKVFDPDKYAMAEVRRLEKNLLKLKMKDINDAEHRGDTEAVKKLLEEYSKNYEVTYVVYEDRYIVKPKEYNL